MMRRAIGRTLNEALTASSRRDRGVVLSAEMKWWGWGDPDRRLGPAAAGGGRPARGARCSGPAMPPSPSRWSRSRCRNRIDPDAVRSAAGEVLDGTEDRRGAQPAGATRPASGSAPKARTSTGRDPAPRRSGSGRGRARSVRRERGGGRVPTAWGTSVVGGLDAVAGAHRAVASLDLARLRSVQLDGRFPHGHARSRAHRPDANPL